MELVSLATERLYSSGDRGLRATTQQLEAAGIRWLGVTSKEENIVMLGGLRVGFLAYCAVHGECVDSTGLPFAPVRYSSKLASSAVGKLRAVGQGHRNSVCGCECSTECLSLPTSEVLMQWWF